MDGDDGVVQVQVAGEERLDLQVGDERPEPLQRLAEVGIDVLALELQEGVQVPDEAVELLERGELSLERALLLEGRGGLVGVVPEVRGGGEVVDLAQVFPYAGFVKDSSGVRGPST